MTNMVYNEKYKLEKEKYMYLQNENTFYPSKRKERKKERKERKKGEEEEEEIWGVK